MKRLLYITNGIYGPGGLERVLSVKASYLADHLNYEVHVATLNQGGKELFYTFSDRIIYHDIEAKGNLLNYFVSYRKGLKEIINSIKPDIISVCDDGMKGLYFPLIIGKPCPIIYERHVSKNVLANRSASFFSSIRNHITYRLMDIGGSTFDAFICLTKGNTNEWKSKNVRVIPNPLPISPDKPSLLQNKKVLAVGRLFEQKGYPLMIEAWQIVAKSFPDWHLDIYGDGPHKKLLVDLIKKYGLNRSIKIHKPTQSIAEKYQEASIYIMSSRFEGFGMVLIEAMASGVPCVSFDCPFGPADIINDGVNGFLVPHENVRLLAGGIINLIEDEKLRREMGTRAQRSISKYHPSIIVEKWDALFRELTQ